MKLDWKILAFGAYLLSKQKKKKAAPAPSPGGMSVLKGTQLTLDQLRQLASGVGFPDPDLAAAVAMAESGGFEGAVGDNGTSFGLWQIHAPAHPEYDTALLQTPWYNAQAALAISSGGKDWEPWTTYGSGAYLKYLPQSAPKQVTSGEPPKELASERTRVAPEPESELVDETTDVDRTLDA